MTVQIVIPYFKAKEKLDRCLENIRDSEYKDFDIYIRDNSLDNILFTAAVNEGIRDGLRSASKRYFLILNQDCYISPTALTTLVNAMDSNPEAGIISPIQTNENNQLTWAGSLDAFPNGKHQTIIDPKSDGAPYETFWANGACMMLRRELVEDIGLLDRNMKFICSDSDYSFTARARGWKVLVCPAATVEHSLQSSAGRGSNPAIELQKLLDVMYFCDKWLTGDLFRKLSFEGNSLDPKFLSHVKKLLEEATSKIYKARRPPGN